jgi:hypothetical protein
MVDRQLSTADLRDRGRRQWWIEALRPWLGQITPLMHSKAVAWAECLMADPIVVISYPPDMGGMACLLRGHSSPSSLCSPSSSANVFSSWSCWSADKASEYTPIGTPVFVTVSLSNPHAPIPDMLVLKSLKSSSSWWRESLPHPSSAWTATSSYIFNTQVIHIRDVIEVRSGVDCGGFRWLVESGVMDGGEASASLCAGIFTQSESYCVEFRAKDARDDFVMSVRVLNKMLLRKIVVGADTLK